jgi:hypothetical protein
VLADAGRLQEARAALDAALDLYERKGAVAAAKRIRAQRAALDVA